MPNLLGIIDECFAHPESEATLTAFDKAVRPLLMAILVSLSRDDPTLADDAYQMAFLKFMRLFQGGRRTDIDYERYIVAIAKYCLIDERRRAGRCRHVEELHENIAEDTSHTVEVRLEVMQALELLNTRCRFVLQRRYLGDATIDELARELNIQPQSVYGELKRCRTMLREILSRSG